jgi:hypothetical protein
VQREGLAIGNLAGCANIIDKPGPDNLKTQFYGPVGSILFIARAYPRSFLIGK